MIRLDTTSSKLTAVLAGAIATTQPTVVVSFSDDGNSSAGDLPGGTKTTTMNSAVAVDICDAPIPATVREIDFIGFRNNDTASVTVTFNHVSSSTKVLTKVTLLTLQSLCYTEGGGWQAYDASGNLKQ